MKASGPAGGLALRVLGAANGLPTAERDTTSLLVTGPDGHSLIDCPGGVVHKLAGFGVRPGDLRRVILTHNHVDHVYGLPHLLHAMAIAGSPDTLEVHGPAQTMETVDAMIAAHGLAGPAYPRTVKQEIPLRERVLVSDEAGLRIEASPAAHGRDTAALRFGVDAGAICHSSDTRPSRTVTALATDAELLLHDCAGPHRLREQFAGQHSSAREAAETAAAAAVRTLILTHLPAVDAEALAHILSEARSHFDGRVELCRDGACYRVGGASRPA